MAYTLGNKCAKNWCKRTIIVQLIVEDVVVFFGTQCSLVVCCEHVHNKSKVETQTPLLQFVVDQM